MSLLTLVAALVVIGIILYLINTFIPMDSKVKQILNIAVIIFIIVWLLQALGLFSAFRDIRIN